MEQIGFEEDSDKVADGISMLDVLGIDTNSFSHVTDGLPVYLWVHDAQNRIVYGNSNFFGRYGNCLKKSCYQCIMGKTRPCTCCLSQKALATNKPQGCKACKRNGSGYDINTFHTVVKNQKGEKFILKYGFHVDEEMDVPSEKNMARAHEAMPEEIFVTMCSVCKRVKDRNRNWLTIDNTILEYFNAKISHGLCLECTDYLYPELNLRDTKGDDLMEKGYNY